MPPPPTPPHTHNTPFSTGLPQGPVVGLARVEWGGQSGSPASGARATGRCTGCKGGGHCVWNRGTIPGSIHNAMMGSPLRPVRFGAEGEL